VVTLCEEYELQRPAFSIGTVLQDLCYAVRGIVARRWFSAAIIVTLALGTLITSNRPVDDWGKLLGDSTAVTAMLDRLLRHGHLLQCGPRSWRTKTTSGDESQ